VGADAKMKPGPGGNRGEFSAWDPVARKKAWSLREDFPVWSGALATAGDVVFYGTMDGWFKAVDAKSGALLWKYQPRPGSSGSRCPIAGPTATNTSAVLAGVGGWAGAIVSGNLDKRDGSAALGFVNAMGDLPDVTRKGGMLYVFRLP
jgi:glucose dehydrogenase